jgi:nucleotidyltransferase substrate binding protein (TIGR01987 family)
MAVSLAEYEKALDSLAQAVAMHASFTDVPTKKLARDACIQRFEFCIELAWKTAGKVLGSKSASANTVIREMARDGLIANPETWFEFIWARNQTSHT